MPYTSLKDAFSNLDYMIDTELEEVVWLKDFIQWLKSFQNLGMAKDGEDKKAVQEEIRNRLGDLKYALVEEKRLARIVLECGLELLGLPTDVARQAMPSGRQVRGCLHSLGNCCRYG